MIVCKCDICNELFEPTKETNDMFFVTYGMHNLNDFSIPVATLDLCPGCEKSFKRWLKRGAIEYGN